jgi:hypothetical protein
LRHDAYQLAEDRQRSATASPVAPAPHARVQVPKGLLETLPYACHVDPGAWPNAVIAMDSTYSPATTGPTLVGADAHAELDGTAARVRRYADERQRGLWNL